MNKPTPSETSLAPGSPLGRYIVRGRIGEGGMAEIYLAELPGPRNFRKNVVIKRLLDQHRDDETLVKMFLDEASVSARFTHSALVQVFELLNVGGTYAIVMEYIEGVALSELVKARQRDPKFKRFEVSHVLNLISNAASGLHHVHDLEDDRGNPLRLVHCDVSPSNLLLSKTGDTKILDFGVVQTAAKDEGSDLFFGTPPYAAPERFSGGETHPRVDVFSLGCVAFELLTGELLRTPAQIRARDWRIDNARLRHPAVPPSIRPILKSMTESKPAKRIQDAGLVHEQLESCVEEFGRVSISEMATLAKYVEQAHGDQSISVGRTSLGVNQSTRQLRAPTRKRWPYAVVAAAILSLGAVLVWFAHHRDEREASPQLKSSAEVVDPPPRPAESSTAVPETMAPQTVAPAIPAARRGRRTNQRRRRQGKVEQPRATPRSEVAVRITTSPVTDVQVRGEQLGRSPVELMLPEGNHAVRLERDDLGLKVERRFSVPPTIHRFELKRGKVLINAVPWAHVYYGTKKVGTTPMSAFELYEGRQTLVLSNPVLGVKRTVVVNVSPGQTVTLTEELN
ncbi:MAG: serine/threonine-protein kinase [Myxococcota bacterium]